jgi:hypothetical protein
MALEEPATNAETEEKRHEFIPASACRNLKSEELGQIVLRRQRAQFSLPPTGAAAKEAVAESLVGLALSGGGIRSASFNLGVLQAFYRHGLLRYVDYLATVSGGGYIGACLSSEIRALPAPLDRDNLPIRAEATGQQRGAVKKLLHAGHYLSHVLLLANQYFIGLAKLNLAAGSLLLAICALLALAWRFLDESPACELILMFTGGTLYEVVRPFLFTLVFLVAWALGWGLSTGRPRNLWWALLLGVGVWLILITAVVGWRFLEVSFRDGGGFFTALHPDDPLWVFLRPLPFLLALAWPLACVVTFPEQSRRTAGSSDRRPWPHLWWVLWLVLWVPPVGALLLAFALRWWDATNWWGGLDGENWAWLFLRPLPFLLVLCWPVGWLLFTWRSEAPSLDVGARLRWLLLLAGVSFLIGCAVWLSTPSISLVVPTKATPANEGRTQLTQFLFRPLFAILLAALLPFLRPQRLLEYQLRPKHFWEPWIFRIACTAAVFGIPLLGVWFFAAHNLSGHNTVREDTLLPYDLEWDRFWRRAEMEAAQDKGPDATGPTYLILQSYGAQSLLPAGPSLGPMTQLLAASRLAKLDACGLWDATPAAWIWSRIGEKDQGKIKENLQKKTWGQPNPLLPSDFSRVQTEVTKKANDLVFDDNPEALQGLSAFCRFVKEQRAIEKSLVEVERQRQSAQWPQLKKLLAEQENLKLQLQGKESKLLARRINRLFLEASYPEEISNHLLIRRSPLILYDQLARFCWFLGFFLIFAVSALLLRINGTSLHQFYRDQLARVYLRPDPGSTPAGKGIPLSGLDTVAKGGPYHLICATFNTNNLFDLLGNLLRVAGSGDVPERPAGSTAPAPASPATAPIATPPKPPPERTLADTLVDSPLPGAPGEEGPTDTFLFSRLYCGSDRTGYCRTDLYRYGDDQLSLGEAVALSGAALSPMQFHSPLSLFMAVLNLRLGQWLPSPHPSPPWNQPSLWQLLFDRPARLAERKYFFISDGGHHENLGLGVLLQRRCRLIIVSDATADSTYTFHDFLRLCRRARLESGVRFFAVTSGPTGEPEEVNLDLVRPRVYRTDYQGNEPSDRRKEKDWLSGQHFLLARIEYPPGEPGCRGVDPFDQQAKEELSEEDELVADGEHRPAYLVYVKPSFTGEEENDLKAHWVSHPEFPNDPTTNQFYDEDMVESYRQLGYHIGADLCEHLFTADAPGGRDVWDEREFKVHQVVRHLVNRLRKAASIQGPQVPAPSSGSPS